jgi:hypothetical protein
MFFRVLKLFGLDIPAEIEAVKASFAQRVEQASEHVKAVAQQAGEIAVLSALAGIAGGLAIAVGLAALYVWVASNEGIYAGLGVVGAILVAAAAILAAIAAAKAKSFAAAGDASDWKPRRIATAQVAPVTGTVMADPVIADLGPPPIVPPPRTTAADLIEPMAFFLSRYLKFPTAGNPVIDGLLTELRASAHVTAHEAVDRAADVIRKGDRTNLVVVLSGAALAGWMLARHGRR